MTTTTQIDEGTDLRYSTPFSLDNAIADYQASCVECERIQADIDAKKEALDSLIEGETSAFRARDDKDLQYLRVQEIRQRYDEALSARNSAERRIHHLRSVDAPEAARTGDRSRLVEIGNELTLSRAEMDSAEQLAFTLKGELAEITGITSTAANPYSILPFIKEIGSQRALAASSAGLARSRRESLEQIVRRLRKSLEEAQTRKARSLEAAVVKATAVAAVVYKQQHAPNWDLLDKLARERSAPDA